MEQKYFPIWFLTIFYIFYYISILIYNVTYRLFFIHNILTMLCLFIFVFADWFSYISIFTDLFPAIHRNIFHNQK